MAIIKIGELLKLRGLDINKRTRMTGIEMIKTNL